MSGKLPHSAFEFYFGLGPSRSYQSVADRFGVTKRAVTKHAANEQWQTRLAKLEEKARLSAEQKALETLDAMNERHLKSLRVIQGKALETLRNMPISSAMEAVRSLDLAIKQERVIRGEPGDRSAVCVEDVIKREYTRWLNVESENGHDDDNAQETEQDRILP